ncbi:MAG TPA: M48 family metalloprotease [Elusimicrobiota bacterium]|nr:M48 family metalloprotease [Elusimicrobiota bacterium]
MIKRGSKALAGFLALVVAVLSPGPACYAAGAQGLSRATNGSASATPAVVSLGQTPALAPALDLSLAPGGLNILESPAALSADPAAVLGASAIEVPATVSAAKAPLIAAPLAAPAGERISSIAAGTDALPRVAPSAPGASDDRPASGPLAARFAAVGQALGFAPRAAELSAADARAAGAALNDTVTGERSISAAAADPVAASGVSGTALSGLQASGSIHDGPGGGGPPSVGAAQPEGPGPGGRILGALAVAARVAASAGAAVGLHYGLAFLLPAGFGFVPVAAVWAVGSGVLLLPVALYARYRLSLRDSPRLAWPKRALDVLVGAFLGAAAVAIGGAWSGALAANLASLAPLAAAVGAGAAGTSALRTTGGTGGWLNAMLAWASLTLIAPLFAVSAAAPLTVAGVIGLLTLPAMTAFAVFLGRIILSAESGRPFAAFRGGNPFPSYTWVMTGVVFALLTGYSPVWVNAAFALWMFMGKTRLFNLLFAGAALWAAATGFGAPITFLVLAFAPERAAAWTEALLARLLPAGRPAPSTRAAPVELERETQPRWPAFHFWLKTGLTLAGLAGLGVLLGATVFGFTSLLSSLGMAALFSVVPLVLSKTLIKKTMQATPMKEDEDPEIYGIMRELRERINAGRTAKGQKPIPMPEMINVVMGVPNAFATGLNPFHAMVGVSQEIKDMLLNPEELRAGLIRLLTATDPTSKAFHVFRKAVRGSVSGVDADAGPVEIARVLAHADAGELKALGARAMRGVLGHEFSHVMHRDMILGAIAGSLASAVSWASYGVLWGAGHAQNILDALWNSLTGGRAAGSRAPAKTDSARSAGEGVEAAGAPADAQPEMLGPVSTGLVVKSAVALIKIFAALWGPVIATLLQMAESRTREGHADEAGAILSEDPESLAIGLGLLTSWRPKPGAAFDRRLLPRIASQAHVMTVNPMEQMRDAGMLPKFNAVGRLVLGKEDDFFFNLFITHPDTGLRIERLYDMAMASGGAAEKATSTTSRDSGTTDGPAPGSLAHPDGGAPSEPEGVDPESDQALATPGLDDRMLPVVHALQAEILSSKEKTARLGHLLWTLDALLGQGGVIRYARTSGTSDYGFYDPNRYALFLDSMLLRAKPEIQAAWLAQFLQIAYDHLQARPAATKESLIRQAFAVDELLNGLDLAKLQRELDINNVVEVTIFELLLRNRLLANSGLDALEARYSQHLSLPQLIARGQDHLELLKRQKVNLGDQLKLVVGGLANAPKNADLLLQKGILEERIAIAGGNILMAEAGLAAARTESTRAAGAGLRTPLATVAHSPALRLDKRLVRSRPKQAIDPKIQSAIDVLRDAIRGKRNALLERNGYARRPDPRVKELEHLLAALERVVASGGRVVFGDPGEGAAASFHPVTLDLIVSFRFENAHPALVAALLAHELTHADDYFEGRPLTRETERNAFINEAIFAGAFDPEKVAATVHPLGASEQSVYRLVYHARQRFVEGNTSLQAMISDAYTELFGAHFRGLQVADQYAGEIERAKLGPTREGLKDLLQRKGLVQIALDNGELHRRTQMDEILRGETTYVALVALYERQIAQLRQAAAPAAANPR